MRFTKFLKPGFVFYPVAIAIALAFSPNPARAQYFEYFRGYDGFTGGFSGREPCSAFGNHDSGGESMRFTNFVRSLVFAVAVVVLPFIAGPAAAQDYFFTHYYDVATSTNPSASGYGGGGVSGGVGDGLVRIVNSGDTASPQNGTICAMIYVFDDIEEMQACCGCPVTPDGLRTMSVINNLTKNFGVNRGNMNAGVIDIMASPPNLLLPQPMPLPPQIGVLSPSLWACDPSFQGGVDSLSLGLRAWMTDTEGNVPVPASKTLVKGTSVSEFQQADLPFYGIHRSELKSFCLFLIQNGSGTGACSCGSGDTFSKAPQPG